MTAQQRLAEAMDELQHANQFQREAQAKFDAALNQWRAEVEAEACRNPR